MSDPMKSMLRKIHGMAARCVLRLVNDGLKMQAVQVGVLADETIDDVERVQNYGLTSVPLPGAEGICLFLGADRAHGVVIAMDDRRYRLKGLKGGEVALYTDEGDSVVLKRGRIMEATTETFNLKAGTAVNIETPVYNVAATTGVNFKTPAFGLTDMSGGAATATMTGSLHTTGLITTDADVVAGTVSQRGHEHPENDNGGPTGPPIGG